MRYANVAPSIENANISSFLILLLAIQTTHAKREAIRTPQLIQER